MDQLLSKHIHNDGYGIKSNGVVENEELKKEMEKIK